MTRWNCNLSIPTNNVGVYINVQTQQTGSSGTGVIGWDFQLYSANPTSPGLTFFCNTTTALQRSTNGVFTPVNLAQGATVGPTSSWSGTGAAWDVAFSSFATMPPGPWVLNSTNYFGFRFAASDGLSRFGYGRMDIGSNANIRTLVFLEWESVTGVGLTVVPAPGAFALLAAAGLGGSRRRRA